MATAAAQTRSSQFTVGKLDAGMAMLLTEDYQLIEFPSVLLPKGVALGSVVTIDTWVVLEWEPLELATAELRSLHLYRDSQRLFQPMPATLDAANAQRAIKITGLDVNQEYDFKLEMRTSAGRLFSNSVHVKTHALTDLSGVCVCFGECESLEEVENLKAAVDRIGASWVDTVSLNVTHFIARYATGPSYDHALALNIPVVKPGWLLACEANNKLQPAIQFYLS
ncbi:BRCT domain-containing protein [Linderina pennispora]|uniref:BRCT domain-containing protein n=1 Tax=Linderina pennispora TaxID=61395 RepID=A0A1Y1W573_9FUNG|nr:BRCT domain-containing protein [Linderina pennispora]ORX68660.1 BRCT domain-containing protein [Linderina pennispora]